MSSCVINGKPAEMLDIDVRCVTVSDTDPASHELLSDGLGFINQA